MSTAASPAVAPASVGGVASRLPRWWPLAALTLLAAVLRLATLDVQSFWLDEAFTPVNVLRASLFTTLRAIPHTENTPPLWYLLVWADSRVLGTGEVALRLPSALAGIASVPVAWAIGRELDAARARRAAVVCAALVAVNPLLIWYSQEARAYGLFVLTAALSMLCFLRALREPTRGRMALFALTGSLALLSEYFAVFLLMPMVLWLLWERRTRILAIPAAAVLAIVGAALVPLVLAQAGRDTQWIAEWPLKQRLEAVAQYYLTGYSGLRSGTGVGEVPKPLSHGIALLVALLILAGLALGVWRMRARRQSLRGATLALSIVVGGILTPVVLAALGADYLAPRNLVGAMIPLSALIAVVIVWPGTGRAGLAIAAAITLAFLAISIDVDVNPNLQRENWRGLASRLAHGTSARAITAVQFYGSIPISYYLPSFHQLRGERSIVVSEIDETNNGPQRVASVQPPAPGFSLRERVDVNGMLAYRFVSPVPRRVTAAELARAGHALTLAATDVFVAPSAQSEQ
jgi:mannosyltransferase